MALAAGPVPHPVPVLHRFLHGCGTENDMKTKIAIGILFLLGAAILLYPTVSDYVNSLHQAEVVENYSDEVKSMEQEKLEQELARARDYNANLARTIVIDPFTETLDEELTKAYLEIANVGGQMGVIKIPRINVELPIYHGTGADVLQKGVGHLKNTSLPVGGEGTHAVLSGHRGLPSAKLFTDLDELEKGDRFYIEVLGETLAYEVDQILVVEPDQTESLQMVDGEDYVTLVTCTPYAVNSHRLLVRGTRVAFTPEAEEELEVQEEAMEDSGRLRLLLFAGVLALVILFFIILFTTGRKDRGRGAGHER